jgi:hypothetical protein
MIQQVINSGLTPESVGVLERMVALNEQVESREAERLFNEAFIALQNDLPVIVASSEIPKRGKYERFEDVMKQIQPHLTKHEFTVSFSQSFEGERVIQTCRLTHSAGHFKEGSFGVRTGRADDNTQADCKASTTAKRNALLGVLNIVIRQDVLQDEELDARLEGAPVSAEQVATLRRMVRDTRSDEAAFLKFAGAATYEEIPASRFDRLTATLKRKGAQ